MILAGPFVRLACKRHLRDLEEGARRGLVWDWAAADRAINFFPDVLRLAEGEFAGRPFALSPFQQFIVGSLFGWKSADGFRRFRVAYLEMGKGNGKTPLAAGIALYMLCADGEKGAQVYAAAPTRDQAQLLFQDAVSMVETSPDLDRRLLKSGKKKVFNLAHLASSSFFRPISSEGRALDGKRIHFAAVDEVHEHPTRVVVEKVRAGTKGRRQALVFLITNSGFDRETVCWEYHELARRILEGVIADKDADAFFAYVCALDEKDDWRDERVWLKANPNLGVSITLKYLREQVAEAVAMPGKQNTVRRLNLCEWTEAENAAIGKAVWESAQREFALEELYGRECWGALDLSLAKDLTAGPLVFPIEEGEALADKYLGGKAGLLAWCFFWTPADTIAQRELSDHVTYSVWRDKGHLIATPGSVVKYGFVARHLADISQRFDLRGVAFDEYRIPALLAELEEIGFGHLPLVKHPQGFRKNADNGLWMPQSVNELETALLDEAIGIKSNPVLTWNASAVVYEADAQGNRKFNKRKATGRIDGIVSLAMGVGLAKQAPAASTRSVYEDRGILELG